MERTQTDRDADLTRRRQLFELTGHAIHRDDDPRPVDTRDDLASMTETEYRDLTWRLSRDPLPFLERASTREGDRLRRQLADNDAEYRATPSAEDIINAEMRRLQALPPTKK